MQEKKNKKRNKRSLKSKIYHSSLVRSMRKNKRFRYSVITVVLVMVLVVAVLITKSQSEWKKYDVSASGHAKAGDGYEYNKNISNILLIGIDSTGPMETCATYGDQARADNIDLISFNSQDKSVKIMPISRDTMTDVTKFSAKGYEVGKIKTHLGFAYSYGNGGNESSMNVCDAVSDFLYGTEVYKYVTTNLDSIGYANDLIGGVTVTVPNNDLAFRYPEMTEGNKVEMTSSNVADFLRYRNTDVDGSNTGRMERQQAFLEAYVKKLETMSKDDYKSMWKKLSSEQSKIKTNMTEKMFLGLLADLKKYKYDPNKDNLHIEGVNTVESGYDVFYPDEKKLKALVRETFFEKM